MNFVRALIVALMSVAISVSASAQEGLPPDMMKSLKASTVYIKTEIGPIAFAGSGFVMAHDADSVLIATNNHVITKPKVLDFGGYIPGLRGRDRLALRKLQSAMANATPVVSVIFNSGDAGEQVIKAEVASASEDPDLAILRVSGVKQKVTALNYDQSPALNETMSVYMLGFPFGDALATNKGNPAITVGKGSVSSIRKDASGKIVKVQIDGALNPGNSGGPVVDSSGRLVGIAVQTIQGSNIGLAIHPSELVSLLGGKVGSLKLTTTASGKGHSSIEATVTVNDPMKKLKNVTVHYVPKAILINNSQLDRPQVAEADGSQALKTTLEGNIARAALPLSPAADPIQVSLQASYVNEQGQTVYSVPQLLWVGSATDSDSATITTVSDGKSSTVTRVEKHGNNFNRNVSVTRGPGAPTKTADLIAKGSKNSDDADDATMDGGFADSAKPESSKSLAKKTSETEKAAKSKAKAKDDADDSDSDAKTNVKWTNSIKKMVGHIPDTELTGKLGGVEFKPDRIEFKGNTLVMRQGSGFFADVEVKMVLWKKPADLVGKKCVVNGQIRQGDPHLNLSIMRDGEKSPKLNSHLNYLMTLEFGEYDSDTRTLGGKLYLCLPDIDKSFCAGTFDAKVD